MENRRRTRHVQALLERLLEYDFTILTGISFLTPCKICNTAKCRHCLLADYENTCTGPVRATKRGEFNIFTDLTEDCLQPYEIKQVRLRRKEMLRTITINLKRERCL